ncbi:MAG: universal stress protein [Candidatus Nanopelagicales bacterium]|jgi:nucleotide-binding universal stress UspA family protein|nr:universal stress protein [Candidatus Nanopelagicales bacterium]
MGMHQKVTFGEDGSPGAVDAWTWLTAHAWSGWDLDVVAVEKPLKSTSDSPMGYDHLHPWEPETPRDVPADCDFAGVSYFTAHHDARLVLGADLQSDLLVIGPRGKGLMKALHIGSTAEWLVQCPNTPTVIARAGGTTRTIMLCIDGSPHADAVVDLLVTLPWIASTSVTVLAVVENFDDIRGHAQTAADRLTAAGATVELNIVEPRGGGSKSDARATVHYVINEAKPDLIAMGTRGLLGMQRLRLGSLASSVVRHSTTSVLLARDHSEDVDG